MSGGTGGTGTVRGYRKLLAFQAAHEVVLDTYQITKDFPKSEQFGLTSQMRRAAVSVTANIVEGNTLDSTPQFLRHLAISLGSCKELEYYFDLASELEYADRDQPQAVQHKCGRAAYLISALSNSLKKRIGKDSGASGNPSIPSAPSAPSQPEDCL